jgi:protoporphyrinogen oxidase
VHDLVILGAGPAGIGAAYRAAREGHDVVVLERAPGPGGAAGSFEVGGMRVDFGSHRLHSSIDPGILSDITELMGDELQRRPRRGRIRLDGRWISFPLRAGDLIRRLSPAFAAGAALDAATSWARRPKADTFEEVLRAGLGPTLCNRFYFPYARKLWGLEPGEISGEQARRRVAASSPGKLLRRMLRGASEPQSFYYPRRGFGSTWEALAEAAEKNGASVRFGATARRIEFGNDRVRLEAGDTTVEAARLWSTIPLALLARMATPEPSQAVLDAAAQLKSRSMLLVYLVLDTDRYSEFDALYLPEQFTPVTRISEPKNYRDGPDPSGRTVLCAEIPCAGDGEPWVLDDGALADLVCDALGASGLPRPRPLAVEVRRLSHAYPVYRAGYEETFDTLDSWAESVPRLLTFGRQGLFAHDNSHHALAMAWAAVDALGPQGSFDDAAWQRARERFRSHVVED